MKFQITTNLYSFKMNFVVLLVIFALTAVVAESDHSPDDIKYYHDIASGKGLYSNFNKIDSLTAENFRQEVVNSSSAWIVEFYNSWCGHCHKFVPVWKKLALNIHDWNRFIKVGAVDCSNSLNTPLCREYEVMFYPTVKYFQENSPNAYLGFLVPERDIKSLREVIVNNLRNYQGNAQLLPYEKNLGDIWEDNNVNYTLAIIDSNSSYVGPEIVLDMSPIDRLKVVYVQPSNKAFIDSLGVTHSQAAYLLTKSQSPVLIETKHFKREEIYNKVQEMLTPKGFVFPSPPDYSEISNSAIDFGQAMALMKIETDIKKKLKSNELNDIVFQVDLESAIWHSLFVEISSHKSMNGEKYSGLQRYINILVKFFPFRKNGISFLNCIRQGLDSRTEIGGQDFFKLSTNCEMSNRPVFLNSRDRWIGCKGSLVTLRGYPCSLWTMFHTLTVQADLLKTDKPREVLEVMTSYIKDFFGCSECSAHFLEMSVTMAGNVSNTEESILWLWKAHNTVNKRLKGDPSEDPVHPKMQFPSVKSCPNCSINEDWDIPEVLTFLKNMYSKISYFTLEDESVESTKGNGANNLLRHEVIANENSFTRPSYSNDTKVSMLWDINILDVSICLFLYLISMVIIILVCIKFYKKTYRKKHYFYDVFQKV